MSEIACCPYCGSSFVRVEFDHVRNTCFAFCETCEAKGPAVKGGTIEIRDNSKVFSQMAIEKWNTLFHGRSYLVVRLGYHNYGGPEVIHETKEAAENEAKRLALRHPRAKFAVVQLVSVFKAETKVVAVEDPKSCFREVK